MKSGAIIAIVVGVVAVLVIALNRGLISSGVQVPVAGGVRGIVAPQPAQNYGGYLSAATAPGVSTFLNTALSGLGNAFGSWLSPSKSTPAPAQGSNPGSPSLAAQPLGPAQQAASLADISGGWMIGPTVNPVMSYNNTSGAAFDYGGLAADNGFDPNAGLVDYGQPG